MPKILRGQNSMPRRFVILVALSFTTGIICREFFSWETIVVLSGIALLTMIIIRQYIVGIILASCVVLSAGQYNVLLNQAVEHTTNLMENLDDVEGFVTKVWTLDGRTTVEMRDVHAKSRPLAAGVHVQFSDPPLVLAGDIARVRCRWEGPKPEQIFRAYSQGLDASCAFPEVFLRVDRSTQWRAHLARWRASFVERVQQSYHHPQVDLLAGILFGVQETMSRDLRQEFRATGTSHIVALSGFNITIIVTVLSGALTSLWAGGSPSIRRCWSLVHSS